MKTAAGGGRLAGMSSREKKEAIAVVEEEPTVKTGFLYKTGARRNWQLRYFVLKKSYLAYFKSPEVTPRIRIGSSVLI